MDWRRITRKKAEGKKPSGAYINLDDLIRIQFKVADFSLLPAQPVSSILAGRYASKLRGRGLNFEELRRYQPGDDIRTIDWKVTARTREPHIRVYSEERDRAVLLIVDQRVNMFFGTRRQFKSVTAAELAAIGAWRAIGVGDRIGAIVFNDTEMTEFAPVNSQQNVMSILSAVVSYNHNLSSNAEQQPNGPMLNRVLKRACQIAHHDALVVVISDFFGIDEQTERLTVQLGAHNDVLGLYPHDPSRRDPGSQKLVVGDGALEMEIDFTDKNIRRKMIENYHLEQEQIQYFLRKISAPLLMINNEEDCADQLRRMLGVRSQAHSC